MAALQFLAPGPDAEDATRRLSSPNASRKTDYRPVWRADLRSVFLKKTRSLDEGLAALNLARNNTPKEQFLAILIDSRF